MSSLSNDLPEPKKGTALQPGSLSGPPVTRLADTITTEVRHYDFLRGLSPQEILRGLKDRQCFSPEHRGAVSDLRQILLLTQSSMIRMNQAHPGLPPDSIAKTLDLVSRPGASVVLLKGRDPADRTSVDHVIGYGIVIRGTENFPDAQNIPPHLLRRDVNHRLIRLFDTDVAREKLPPGEAFSRIIETIKEISPGGNIVGMVLTDILPMDPSATDPNGKKIWLEAKSALEKRGFEDSNEIFTEVIQQKGQPTVAIPFHWYVWPPLSDSGRDTYLRHQQRFQTLKERQRERLAGILPTLPLSRGFIRHIGSARDAFDIAFQFPGDVVHAQLFSVSDRGGNRRGRLSNLIQIKETKGPVPMPPQTTDAVVINGVIPDITGNGASPAERAARLEEFLRPEKASLRPGGFFVVRDTVKGSFAGEAILRLAQDPTPPWANGRPLPELFKEFVADRREGHISEAEWNRVMPRGEHHQMTEFSAPSSVAHEFLAKYPYVSDWSREQLRPYTQHSPEERVGLVTGDGFRLVYAGPEQSSYVHHHYREGLVELYDRAGNRLDLPPTNYLAIAQKVEPHEGVGFSVGKELDATQNPFVHVVRYERLDPESKRVVGFREVAIRPKVTLDVIPYCIADGRLYVSGRIYPRPLTVVHPNLDGSKHGGYLTEQLASIIEPSALESASSTAGTAVAFLDEGKLIGDGHVEHISHTSRYFVRPDTVDEEVVATAALVSNLPSEDRDVEGPKGSFGDRYRVRTFDAMTLLQGQQTGFSEDPRLERKVYELLHAHSLPVGPWLGDKLKLVPQESASLVVAPASQAIEVPRRRVFQPAASQECCFLSAHRREFLEHMADPALVDRRGTLEYVEPHPSTGLSHQSMAILPIALRKSPDGTSEIVVGLEIKDLPAAQERLGSSAIATVPTTRIPIATTELWRGRAHAATQLREKLGLECRNLQSLGGKYVVSPGVTPEVIYPMVAEVDLSHSRNDSLLWVSLREALPLIPSLHCGQAITLLYRAAHMLGVMEG